MSTGMDYEADASDLDEDEESESDTRDEDGESEDEDKDKEPGVRRRVLEYGMLAPTEGLEVVIEQMRLARRYQNKLAEIERKRRKRVWVLEGRDPDVARLRALHEHLQKPRLVALRAAIYRKIINKPRRGGPRSRTERTPGPTRQLVAFRTRDKCRWPEGGTEWVTNKAARRLQKPRLEPGSRF